MANRPLTRKEWMAYLEKACDEFDWEGANKPCSDCEYHKNRAARWRAEAYKQAGHDVIELPWVGLTADELNMIGDSMRTWNSHSLTDVYVAIEAKLKEKNA